MFNLLKIYQNVSTRISSEMAVAFWIPINHCCSSLPPFGIVSSLYFSEFSKYVVAPYLSFNSLIVYSVRYLIKRSLDISVSLLMRIFLPTFFLTNAVSLSISEFLNIFKSLPIWFLFLNYFEIFFWKCQNYYYWANEFIREIWNNVLHSGRKYLHSIIL